MSVQKKPVTRPALSDTSNGYITTMCDSYLAVNGITAFGRTQPLRALLYKKSWSKDQQRSAYFSRTYQKPKHNFVVPQEKLILGALNTAITILCGYPPSLKVFLLSIRHVCQTSFDPLLL